MTTLALLQATYLIRVRRELAAADGGDVHVVASSPALPLFSDPVCAKALACQIRMIPQCSPRPKR